MNNLGIARAPLYQIKNLFKKKYKGNHWFCERYRLAQVSIFNITLVLSSIRLNSAKHRYFINGREWELKFLKHSKICKKYQNINTTQKLEQVYDRETMKFSISSSILIFLHILMH